MKRLIVIALVVAIAVGIGIVAKNKSEAPAVEANVPVDSRLVDANNRFGIGLFKTLVSAEKGENVFISPASVAIALSMTYNGAGGDTKLAMAKVLGLRGMSLGDVNKANEALLANLRGPGPGVEMSLANSLWARDGVPFNQDFIGRNEDFYGAKVTTLDFGQPKARDTINSWVRDETEGRISELVDKIDSAAVLYLINAIYFKGEWKVPFEPGKTHDAPFTLPDGSTKQVRMMHNSDEYEYLEEPGFQGIKLPYGSGRVAMYVFLPDKKSSLGEFYKQLTPENWKQWEQFFTEVRGDISLPRFKVEYETEMSRALKAIGMGLAFDQKKADFAGMSPVQPLYINRVLHKAFLEVNEEGAEAAAATGSEMTAAALPMSGPFTMVVDRPFFVAIRDTRSGEMLFMGAVNRPE